MALFRLLLPFAPVGAARSREVGLTIQDLIDQLNANIAAAVSSGTANRLAYYTSSTTVAPLAAITASRALVSDSNGLPTHSTVTTTELGYVSGVTSAIQTQITNLASPQFVVIGNTGLLPNERNLTGTTNQVVVTDNGANSTVVLSTPQNIHTAATPTFASETLTATSNQLVLGTTRTVTLTAPTPGTSSRTVTIPDLSGDYTLLGTIGTQTITGAKTFASSTLLLQEASGTDVVTIAVAALGSGRTYTVPDAGGAASFVMTESAQTVNGQKTFGSALLAPNGSTTNPAYSFTNDPDCGMRRATTNALGFTCNGADSFGVSTSGMFPGDVTSTSAGVFNLGDGGSYWNDISYKTLTDRGCLPWCDEGVQMPDGRVLSDLQAICALQKHPTKKTGTGLPRLDYSTFPTHAQRRAEDEWKSHKVTRNQTGDAFVEKTPGKPEPVQDGVEMTMIFGVMLGAFKEVAARLEKLEKK